MSCTENPQANFEKATALLRQAAKQGANILCLSELFRSIYFCQTKEKRFFDWAEPVPGPTSEALSALAKELGVVIVASIFEKEKGNHFFNTACVLDTDGKFLGKYRKVHIPNDAANYMETHYFESGNLGYPIFHTKFGKIGVLICWDQWYPEPPRVLAAKGAEIIFYPTAIGFTRGDSGTKARQEYEAWQIIQRSHAIANNVFVAAVNRVGKENAIDFWGTSFVAGPLGEILEKAPQKEEKVCVVPCDLNQIAEVRKDWPFLDCRRSKVEA